MIMILNLVTVQRLIVRVIYLFKVWTAPPISFGLLDPVENEFPDWDSDDDNGCMPLTARRLRRRKRILWKIVKNPDGTITKDGEITETIEKTKKQDELT